MELTADTRTIAKYSPTSTPILDMLRPLPSRKRDKISAGEYFFLSSAVILTLLGLPLLRPALLALSSLGSTRALVISLLVIPALALGAALAAHECGHLLAAWLGGFRPAIRSANQAGDYSTTQRFYSCPGLRMGVVRLEPAKTDQNADQLRRRLLILMAGGSLASMLLPPILEVSAYLTDARGLATFSIHVFSTLSLLIGVAELIPDA